MSRLTELLSELWQIGREGTWAGAFRYVRFKRLGPVKEAEWVPPSGPERGLGIVGAGNYLASMHLACLRALGAPLYAVASGSGDSARAISRVYRIGVVHSNIEEMLTDKCCEGLLIATPHHLHPPHILAALKSGLYTYCEKPVAIDETGIGLLEAQGLNHPGAGKIMIGLNRRFAPAVSMLRHETWLQRREQPVEMHYRVNFGPKVNNTMSDPLIGGGRIHGAACHYVDLITFLVGAPVVRVSAMAASVGGRIDENTFAATLMLADGSVASLSFTSEGHRRFSSKEEVMLSCGKHVARIVDYAELSVDGRRHRFFRHRYGALNAMSAFLAAKRSGVNVPVGLADGIAATKITLAIQSSLRHNGEPVDVAGGDGAISPDQRAPTSNSK